MNDDARTLIAQHAKTAQLMGVDFLPLGNVGVVSATEQEVKPRNEIAAIAPRESVAQVPDFDGVKAAPIGVDELRLAYEGNDDPQAKLEALRAKYESEAPHQHFNPHFTNIVFGEGSPSADLMFVGEAPGEEEDRTGMPFVGRAGQLLEKMIHAMGLSRETVYICNVLKTRPPGNATPTLDEAALCSPYLLEQIRIVSPRVIVTLGLPASHLLLHTTSPMRSMRGHWHGLPAVTIGTGIPAVEIMPTYHPAYLLRSYTKENRQKVWSDLTQVMKKLDLSPSQ